MSGSAAAASYPGAHPRYPTAGSGAPFGGLGGIIPPPVTASHLGSHTPRPAHPAYPAYPGVHHGLKEKEEAERRAKERREAEERERDRERERRHREEVQQARDSEARASREGFPAYVREVREVRERDKNGEERERDRSPVRGEAGAESGGQQSLQGVDMRVTPTSRPPSSLSQDPANLVKSAGGTDLLTKKEERICDDISIIAEKEGTRSGANSVTGRASVNSDHSISRLNGLESSSQSPLVTSNGVKSDSPHQAAHQARPAYPGPASLYPSARPGQASVPPPVSSYLPPSHPSHHPLAPPPPPPTTPALWPCSPTWR